MRSRALVPTLVGVGGAAAVTAGLVFGLSFPPLLAGALGVVIGGGGAFLTVPGRGRDEDAAAEARRVATLLHEAAASASRLEPRLRALRTAELWTSTPLDENLLALCASVRSVASLPALTERRAVDGDILMLHAVGTEYLPEVARLAEEHDGMFAGFSDASRAEVVQNVADLNEQSLILAEGVRRIEKDILRGTSRDVHQHTEYLRARFTELGVTTPVDFDRAFQQLEDGAS